MCCMKKSVAKNTIWLTGSLVAQKVLSFVYFALIARMLGVEDMGTYVFAVSFVALFGILADSGLTPVAIREVAKERDYSQFSPTVLRTVVASVKMKLVLIVCAGVLAVVVSHLLGYEHHIVMLVAATTGVMALDAIHLFGYGLLRGLQNLSYEAVGMFLGQAVVVSVGWYILSNELSMFYLIGALAIGSFINVVQACVHVWKAGVRIPWCTSLQKSDFKHVIRMAWPFALAGVLARGYAQIDIVLLSRLSDISAVGLYAVPSKMVFAFQFIPIAMAAALYPAMSRAFVSSREKLSDIVHRAMLYLGVIAAPLILMLFVMASFIVTYVFGDQYVSSIVLLQVLCFSMIFGFLDFPIGALLNATNNQRLQTLSMFFTLVTNLVLNIILIPRIGAYGAVIAAVAGQAVLFVTGLYFARRVIQWDRLFFIRNAAKIAAAVGVVYVGTQYAMPWFKGLIESQTQVVYQLGLLFTGLALMGIAYGILILMLRVVTVRELVGFIRRR